MERTKTVRRSKRRHEDGQAILKAKSPNNQPKKTFLLNSKPKDHA